MTYLSLNYSIFHLKRAYNCTRNIISIQIMMTIIIVVDADDMVDFKLEYASFEYIDRETAKFCRQLCKTTSLMKEGDDGSKHAVLFIPHCDCTEQKHQFIG